MTIQISESRQIGQKYYETKLAGMFTCAAKDLTKLYRIGSSTVYTTNALITAIELGNPDTKAGLHVTIHATSSDKIKHGFNFPVSTSRRNQTIPATGGFNIVLNRRGSKIVATDFTLGNKTLLYSRPKADWLVRATNRLLVKSSTAEDPSHDSADGNELLAASASHKVATGTTPTFAVTNSSDLLVSCTQGDSVTVIQFDDFIALFVPRTTTWKFQTWTLTNDPNSPADKLVIVTVHYLVRGTPLSKNGAIPKPEGNADSAMAVEVFAASKGTNPSLDITGSKLSAKLSDTLKSGWKVADGLPERFANHSDFGARWKLANETTTPNPTKPSTLPTPYAGDYGLCPVNVS
ncbi:hypothetical protein RhiJN_22954 [Ceratobasidium sp. AG-Ba]|nr:hypothetical protein RhiJN_22954 [Ceratobasidium sp. AG-Ba]